MKRFLLCALAMLLCCATHAETAMDYAIWLEEALPDAAFEDADIPGFVTAQMGADYDFIARSDESYGCYIAGVRRSDAPALPDDVHQSSYGGTFETRVFRAEDNAGNIYYDFVLADNVYMSAFDGLDHLIILTDPENSDDIFAPNARILRAADPQYRAQLIYAADHGFSLNEASRCQMVFPVHSLESWQAGATDQPHHFYLNMNLPEAVLGEKYLEEDALIRYARIPIGISLRDDGLRYELVLSEDGTMGVETDDPHRLYAAGPGCSAILDLAEKLLGYRPGNADFLGKTSVRAALQWQDGQSAITQAESLRRLDALLNSADFTVGSVNCPSPCFLTVEYSDGSSASMAVAINSFDLFFYNGLYFTAGDRELLDIFNLDMEEIYV